MVVVRISGGLHRIMMTDFRWQAEKYTLLALEMPRRKKLVSKLGKLSWRVKTRLQYSRKISISIARRRRKVVFWRHSSFSQKGKRGYFSTITMTVTITIDDDDDDDDDVSNKFMCENEIIII